MAEVNINLKCDLQHAVKVQYLDGNLFSQDAAANIINIEVTDGGAPATIGGTVSANVIRPDGGTVAVTGGTISGNIVSITLPAACYALVGMITIVVKLTSSSVVTTLAAAVAYVYQSSTDTVVDPGTVVSSIQDLIDDIDTAVASIPADYSSLWTKLAPAFSSSTAYTAGQYVTYNGGLYRFTTAHAAGSWASGDVVAVNLGGELSDVKSALNVKSDIINDLEVYNHDYTNDINMTFASGSGSTRYIQLTNKLNANGKYLVSFVVNGFSETNLSKINSLGAYAGGSGAGYINDIYAGVFENGTKVQVIYEATNNITYFALRSATMTLDGTETIKILVVDLEKVKFASIETEADVDALDERIDGIVENRIDPLSVSFVSDNLLNPDEVENNKGCKTDGTIITYNGGALSGYIHVTESKKILFGNDGGTGRARYVTAFNSEKTPIAELGEEYATSYTVPSGVSYIRITAETASYLTDSKSRVNAVSEYGILQPYAKYGTIYEPLDHDDVVELKKESIVISTNLLNLSELETEKLLNSNGTLSPNASYATTGFIPVSVGDSISINFGDTNQVGIRRALEYNSDKNVIVYVHDLAALPTSFTVVSDDTAFVRVCARNDYMTTDTTRINIGSRKLFEEYYKKHTDKKTQENASDISEIKKYTLSTLPSYVVNTLKSKQLGVLSKGYVCFVSDDGHADVETFTIPLFEEKEVPCTLAMMEASAVLQSQTGLAAVLDAVENHGFSVAQHGGSYWTGMDEYTLNKFFDSEEEYWQTIGINVHGAVAPGHQVNDMICAVCGGRFGVLRVGYNETTYYINYINGPRSNIYSLSAVNIEDYSLEQHQAHLDLTKENKWLRIFYFHEATLSEDERTRLGNVIDYAKSIGLTFITLGDIPNIV